MPCQPPGAAAPALRETNLTPPDEERAASTQDTTSHPSSRTGAPQSHVPIPKDARICSDPCSSLWTRTNPWQQNGGHGRPRLYHAARSQRCPSKHTSQRGQKALAGAHEAPIMMQRPITSFGARSTEGHIFSMVGSPPRQPLSILRCHSLLREQKRDR